MYTMELGEDNSVMYTESPASAKLAQQDRMGAIVEGWTGQFPA